MKTKKYRRQITRNIKIKNRRNRNNKTRKVSGGFWPFTSTTGSNPNPNGVIKSAATVLGRNAISTGTQGISALGSATARGATALGSATVRGATALGSFGQNTGRALYNYDINDSLQYARDKASRAAASINAAPEALSVAANAAPGAIYRGFKTGLTTTLTETGRNLSNAYKLSTSKYLITLLANPANTHRILFKNAGMIDFLEWENIRDIYCKNGEFKDCIRKEGNYLFTKNSALIKNIMYNDSVNKKAKDDEQKAELENAKKVVVSNNGSMEGGGPDEDANAEKAAIDALDSMNETLELDEINDPNSGISEWINQGYYRLPFDSLNDALLTDDPTNPNFNKCDIKTLKPVKTVNIVSFKPKYELFYQLFTIYKYQVHQTLWGSGFFNWTWLIDQISTFIGKHPNIKVLFNEDIWSVFSSNWLKSDIMLETVSSYGKGLYDSFVTVGNEFVKDVNEEIGKNSSIPNLGIESGIETSASYLGNKASSFGNKASSFGSGLSSGLSSINNSGFIKDVKKMGTGMTTDFKKAGDYLSKLSPTNLNKFRVVRELLRYYDFDAKKYNLDILKTTGLFTKNYPKFMELEVRRALIIAINNLMGNTNKQIIIPEPNTDTCTTLQPIYDPTNPSLTLCSNKLTVLNIINKLNTYPNITTILPVNNATDTNNSLNMDDEIAEYNIDDLLNILMTFNHDTNQILGFEAAAVAAAAAPPAAPASPASPAAPVVAVAPTSFFGTFKKTTAGNWINWGGSKKRQSRKRNQRQRRIQRKTRKIMYGGSMLFYSNIKLIFRETYHQMVNNIFNEYKNTYEENHISAEDFSKFFGSIVHSTSMGGFTLCMTIGNYAASLIPMPPIPGFSLKPSASTPHCYMMNIMFGINFYKLYMLPGPELTEKQEILNKAKEEYNKKLTNVNDLRNNATKATTANINDINNTSALAATAKDSELKNAAEANQILHNLNNASV